MAKFRMNRLVEKATGTVGTMSFRTVGKTILFSSNPERKSTRTEEQRLHRERFKKAAAYAKGLMDDPIAKAAYAKKAASSGNDFVNAFTMAMRDYLRTPSVDSLDHSAYRGQIGDVIRVSVSDDFKVEQVTVSIILPDGELHESGVAVKEPDTAEFMYTATRAHAGVAGSTIRVTVTDKPGNVTTFNKIL